MVTHRRNIKYKIRWKTTEYERILRNATIHILNEISDQERIGKNQFNMCIAAIYGASVKISEEFKIVNIITQKSLAQYTKCPEFSMRYHWINIIRKKL